MPARATVGLVADGGEHVLQRLPVAGVGVHVVVRAERHARASGPAARARSQRASSPAESVRQHADVEAAREGLGQRRHPLRLVGERQQRDQPRAALGELAPAACPPRPWGGPAGSGTAPGRGAGSPRHPARRRTTGGASVERHPGPVDELQPCALRAARWAFTEPYSPSPSVSASAGQAELDRLRTPAPRGARPPRGRRSWSGRPARRTRHRRYCSPVQMASLGRQGVPVPPAVAVPEVLVFVVAVVVVVPVDPALEPPPPAGAAEEPVSTRYTPEVSRGAAPGTR